MENQTSSEIRATANDHMRRDLGAGRKWVCQCDACVQMRSLVGLDKMLDVWPLVREIREIEERLHQLGDGPDRQNLQEQYFKLYDRLADVMEKEA
jgi:hypothetical protein